MQPQPRQELGANRPASPRLVHWAAALGVALFVASRVTAIYTVAINWDEFALLDGVARSLESGILKSGGRPGLAQLVLVSFVEGCSDEIAVARAARLAWLGLTLVFLTGLGVLLHRLLHDRAERVHDAWLGVALLAWVPAFLEWSIQVRTDHIALAGGVWGAVALLASQRRVGLALVAGLLFGVGFLASQKLVYVAALAGSVTLAALFFARELRPSREAARAALCGVGFAAVFLGFRALLSSQFELPETHPSQQIVSSSYVKGSVDLFDFYRGSIGWSQYRAMLPTLVPHFALLAALVAASAFWVRRRDARPDALIVAWALLLLGIAVACFHAAAFAYFWMTLGLFPAVALAVAQEPIRRWVLPEARARTVAFATFWIALALPGISQIGFSLVDSQAVQRDSLAFVRRNFAPSDAGFHPERGPFCRAGGQPIPLYFSQTIYREFVGDHGDANTERMLGVFRDEPIKFILQSFRLDQFPGELRRFWSENYQPYRDAVFVAGRRLQGKGGARSEFDLVVPGDYRWVPFAGPQPLRIDGRKLAAGEVVELVSGRHAADFVEDVPGGVLILALREPPGRAPLAFYKAY